MTATWASFVCASIVYVAPGALVGLALALTTDKQPPVYIRDLSTPLLILQFFDTAILYPALETLLLTACIALAARRIANRRLACVLGAVPIILLHFTGGWPKLAAVAWSFVWSSWCYLALRQQGASYGVRYAFLFGMHALGNALLMTILAASMSRA